MSEEYPISDLNKVKRVPKRGTYDVATVHSILDDGFVAHVSFVQNQLPFVMPMIYGRLGSKIYLHGATTSRLVKELEKGLPVSMGVTHLDALVLARSAFHHSMNYRSVIVFGKAFLADNDEKLIGLKAISDNLLNGRWEEVRAPNENELKATSVLVVEIETASAKVRKGPPNDEKEDYNLTIWAGTIPMEVSFKVFESDPDLKEGVEVSDSVKNRY